MNKITILLLVAVIFSACRSNQENTASEQLADSTRIVSMNGTLSEIVAGLGLEKQIVGVDVTSNYPESLKDKPKIGHNRNMNAEGIMALQPDLVIGMASEASPQLLAQLKAAGIKTLLFNQEFSVDGARTLIKAVGDSLKSPVKADSLINQFDTELGKSKQQITEGQEKPKVLFIYARGTGSMMVGGKGTQVAKVVELAGGQNAVTGFEEYKPLTAEALVQANPDVILLFDGGLESVGGVDGLAKVQGIQQTKAGKNKKIITMDGSLLTNFGPRLGKAVAELTQKLK
jgi:iron complex transport system substrate-binding protein